MNEQERKGRILDAIVDFVDDVPDEELDEELRFLGVEPDGLGARILARVRAHLAEKQLTAAQAHLLECLQARRRRLIVTPRYDDVFFAGLAAMDWSGGEYPMRLVAPLPSLLPRGLLLDVMLDTCGPTSGPESDPLEGKDKL